LIGCRPPSLRGVTASITPERAHRPAEALGPFVMLTDVLPFYRYPRAVLLDVPLVLTAGSAFHREILENPAVWRPVSLLPGGPRNSAARP